MVVFLANRANLQDKRLHDRIQNRLNGTFNKFVKKHPVRRILPHLEAEQDNVLMACVSPFRELRGVASNSSP
jgi:hypothetical protein